MAYQTHQVDELPTPKPKKSTPTKVASFYLFCTPTHILLERRPETGLWGGLWTLPNTLFSDYSLPLNFNDITPLTPMPHAFTHFKLILEPSFITLEHIDELALEAQQKWFKHSDWPDLGLPAPIRRLCEQVLPKTTRSTHEHRPLL